MSRQYFGTDGIRGTVGVAPITADFAMRLGQAVGSVLKREQARPSVLIGKDTRISGYMLESAMEAGLVSVGVDVSTSEKSVSCGRRTAAALSLAPSMS